MNKLERAKDITLKKWKQIHIDLSKLIEAIESTHTCGFCQEYECEECEGESMCNKVKQFINMPLDSAHGFLDMQLLPYLKPKSKKKEKKKT